MSGTEIINIDLDKCYGCRRCADDFPGIYRIIEQGIRMIVCRHCENPPCVAACPVEALEKEKGKDLKRHDMICVSCKYCAAACPVGANPGEILSYRNFPVHGTDFQKCVKMCKKGAVEITGQAGEGYEMVGKRFAVKADGWRK